MACNCGSPGCTSTVQLTNCEGCQYTLNTDCVIYNDERLLYESQSVTDNSARTLTSILKALETFNYTRPSKIIQFNTDGINSYTLVPEDTTKVLLLTQIDGGITGTITNTITLPQTAEFMDCEIIIKDISAPADTLTTNIEFLFNLQIQYGWDPVATSNELADLWNATHKTLKLRFVKTTPTSYQWIVVP